MPNMKMSSHEGGDTMISADDNKPQFPYGLRLNLNDEVISRLGIGDVSAGDVVDFVAQASIVEVSKEPNDDNKRSMTFQITEMEMKGDGKKSILDDKSASDKFYKAV